MKDKPRLAQPDWRKRPRKPAASKRTAALTIRITAAEKEAMARNAAAAGLTLVDWIVRQCGDR